MDISLRFITANVLGNWKTGFIENRDDLMAELLTEESPDVIALQEMSKRYRRESPDLFSLLSPAYSEVTVPVFNRSHNNGTPLAVRNGRFDLTDKGYYFFQDGFCDNSKSVTWAVLRDRETGFCCGFASTHFIHLSEDGRVIDAQQLALLCAGLAEAYGCPVIVGGDLNTNMKAPAYAELTQAGFTDLITRFPGAPREKSYHPYPVLDEAAHLYVPSEKPAEGDYTDSIDHILYYGPEEQIPAVTGYRLLLDDRARAASDHCPVVCDLCFTT